MTTYDPVIIRCFADELYRRAAGMILTAVSIGLLVGGSIGIGVASAVRSDGRWIPGILLLGSGALLGYLHGRSRAFALKLQAQTALCQMQIEENTRKHAIAR